MFEILDLKKYYDNTKGFDWKSYLRDNNQESIATYALFNDEQKDTMAKEYMPEYVMQANYLTCDFPYNPRAIWAAIVDLNVDDITDIYREIGIITMRDDPNDMSKSSNSALVLLPKNLDKTFIKYPNVSCVEQLSHLNISCIHRESIKLLYGGPKNVITKNYPHLIKGDSLDLLENKIRLDMSFLFQILSTCIDLASSPVSYLLSIIYLIMEKIK